MKKYLLTATIAAVMLLPLSASATIFQFEAMMNGVNEVPPNASPGFGTAFAEFNDVTNILTILPTSNFNDLLSPVTASHVHRGAFGVNGPVIIPLTISGGPTDGFISGSGMLIASDVPLLFTGGLYVNVHSGQFPGGEIRGQLILVPAPGALALMGLAGLAGSRRRRR